MSKTITFRASDEIEAIIEDISRQTGIPAKSDVIKMVLQDWTPKKGNTGGGSDRIILKNDMTKEDRDKLLKENGVEFNKFSKEYQFLEDRIKMLPVYIPKI